MKNLPYFDGIDWEKVAERKNDPPFEPIQFELNVSSPLDVTKEFVDDDDYSEHELEYLPKFSSKLNERWPDAALIQINQFNFRLFHLQTIPMWLQSIGTDGSAPVTK